MSDSSDVDRPIGLDKKAKDQGIERDDLSDYLSDDSMDSQKKAAAEEEEIRQHRIQMAKNAAKKEEQKKAILTG